MTALDVALAYHDAWTSKNFERAMTYIADDIVCEAPAGRIVRPAALPGCPPGGSLTQT
jgi:hypothetical protein